MTGGSGATSVRAVRGIPFGKLLVELHVPINQVKFMVLALFCIPGDKHRNCVIIVDDSIPKRNMSSR